MAAAPIDDSAPGVVPNMSSDPMPAGLAPNPINPPAGLAPSMPLPLPPEDETPRPMIVPSLI